MLPALTVLWRSPRRDRGVFAGASAPRSTARTRWRGSETMHFSLSASRKPFAGPRSVALMLTNLVEAPTATGALIRHSKIDQKGHGQEVTIPRGCRLRPVEAAVQPWLAAAETNEGPVFRPVLKGGRMQPVALARAMSPASSSAMPSWRVRSTARSHIRLQATSEVSSTVADPDLAVGRQFPRPPRASSPRCSATCLRFTRPENIQLRLIRRMATGFSSVRCSSSVSCRITR
jgi:hypothetical protein